MENVINRTEIAEGIFFSHITDKRYKTNRISISLFTQLGDNASVNALIPRLLAASNSACRKRMEFSERQAALYSSRIDFSVSSIGDTQQLELYSNSIDDHFALENEDITAEVTQMLIDCLTAPNFEGGQFLASDISQEKKALIDTIEAELNEKRVYARNRLFENLYQGEPAAVCNLGNVTDVKAITPESATKAYHDLLSSAQIEIIAVGTNDFKAVKERFQSTFKTLKRQNVVINTSLYSTAKPETLHKTERLEVTQSKMAMGYKTASHDYAAISVMTMILGGMTTSKLFVNVREKLSLCYYCWASFVREKGAMIIDSGVETENIEKAKSAIADQLKSIADGDFSDSDIEVAKITLANNVKTISDSTRGVTSWYQARIYRDDIVTPLESLKRYEKVDREAIIREAKAMKLDTIYILTGGDGE